MKQPCTNNTAKKTAEVAEGMRLVGNYDGMRELYRRGCFRHIEDVAFARIALEKWGQSIGDIATRIDSSYEGPQAVVHDRCDRIYPPS